MGDGGSEISTTTVDADGNGTKHTTGYDKDGNPVSDNVSTVTPDDPAEPDEPDNSDNKSDNDKSGDDGTGKGDGDKGMDWDGSDEGPRSVFPKHTASIFDVVEAPKGDAGEGGEEPEAFNERIAKGLSGRAIAPGSTGDGGFGDSGGSESFADIKLSEASIFSLGKVLPPTNDWGGWNDPRVHVAYVGALLSSLANTVGTARPALSKSLISIRRLSGEVATQMERASE